MYDSLCTLEIPKLEDFILNFQILFNVRNGELKMLQHTRRTFLYSVYGL